jgi:hypothetical protein
MAYIVPLEQPLSESQAKLIAQVGSMKNLTDLSFLKKFKLKKDEEVSLFDYLIKVLRAMGIDPQILLTSFLNEFFRTDKMVEFLFSAIAKLAAAMYKKLDPNYELSFPLYACPGGQCALNEKMTDDQIVELVECNYRWLDSQTAIKEPLSIALTALKTRMIQELMILIFGKPKKNEAAVGTNGLVNDMGRLNELIEESVCGGNQIFSISVPASSNYGEIEYNRLQKVEQMKKGNLSFQITCQGVQISLPDDPMYLFKDVPPGFQGGQSVTPQAAMTNIFNYVSSQTQRKITGENSQSNAASAEKSFVQKFLETLISSITCLVSPYFVGFIGGIPGEAQGVAPQATQLLIDDLLTNGLLNAVFPNSVTTDPNTGNRVGEFVPATSCEITNSYDKENLTEAQKKKIALMTILCNLMLNMLIGYILAYVLEKVKEMIKKYIAKRAQARIQRKIDKMKKKFETSTVGRTTRKAEKTAHQVRLLQKIAKLLKSRKNSSVPKF